MNSLSHKRASRERLSTGKGEDRRAHILDNALELFATQGIAGTTIAQIATASGVTSAMVHYYFTNREGLLDGLVAERLAPCVDYMWAGVSEETLGDPKRILTEFVDRLFDMVERMPQLPLLWSREILNTGGGLRERIFPLIPLDKIEAVQHSFATAQDEGRVSARVVPGLVITSIMAVVILPLAVQIFFDKIPVLQTWDTNMLRQHALAMLWDGLRPEEGARGR